MGRFFRADPKASYIVTDRNGIRLHGRWYYYGEPFAKNTYISNHIYTRFVKEGRITLADEFKPDPVEEVEAPQTKQEEPKSQASEESTETAAVTKKAKKPKAKKTAKKKKASPEK